MDLAIQLFSQINDATLSADECALKRCALAYELEDIGDYEAARAAMAELWRRVGEHPQIGNLGQSARAEVLLRAGSLTGWLGIARQIAGAQEIAKDLLCESVSLFDSLGFISKSLEAKTEIAWSYWREGAFDEARVILQDISNALLEQDSDLKLLVLIRRALVELELGHLHDALQLFEKVSLLIDFSESHSLKGRYFNGLAIIHRRLGASEKNAVEYVDSALIHYAAASYHFEEAGHTRYTALVENNIGYLLYKIGRFAEAIEHLTYSRKLATDLKDEKQVAQVDDTFALLLLAQDRAHDAKKVINNSVMIFQKGDHQALLAEALTTQGIVFARLDEYTKSYQSLVHAAEVAEQVGDVEGAGKALLTLLEEMGSYLSKENAGDFLERAQLLLAKSQHAETLERLRRCRQQMAFDCIESAEPHSALTLIRSDAEAREIEETAREICAQIPVLYDHEFGDAVLSTIQEIYRPGDDLWFAYVDVRSIYNRYGDLIGYVDGDGVTVRSTMNCEPMAHQVGGIFYTPQGDVWGVTSAEEAQLMTRSEVTV